jgi:hypothetical protein
MSKPKAPRERTHAKTKAPATAESSLFEILREKVLMQTEIMRRERYQELLALRDTLAQLPAAPDEKLD